MQSLAGDDEASVPLLTSTQSTSYEPSEICSGASVGPVDVPVNVNDEPLIVSNTQLCKETVRPEAL